jgi:hypothetical protein
MTSFVAHRRLLHPADAKLLRVSMTYVLPGLAVFYVVLSGLWLLPDSFLGMYGNHDGHWASWSARSILEWGGFLDFSPVSPLTGTGSPFLPNLPWLNPGALALAIPAPLPLRHLASMLVYLAELSASLYLLYRHLEFSREQSYLATILYICIFFLPFSGYTLALPWYTLAPFNAHLIAAMNVATIALIRVGYERVGFKLLFGFVFLAALFVGFASAPVTFVTYVPIYATLWLAFLIPFQAQRAVVLWRWATIAFSLLALALMGTPFYLAAMAMTSARGDYSPPIFHPGWKLLSPADWLELLSSVPLCSNQMQLMCPSSIIGWFEIAVLAGAAFLAFGATGAKRRYGFVIIALLALLHFYALLSMQQVLGRLHVVSTPYLMWAFFPLTPPAAVAAGGVVGRWLVGREAASSRWAPAVASCIVAAVAMLVWVKFILPHQPRVPGRGPLGLGPIAHIPASKGPILDFLQQHIGLKPGSEFRGYAVTFLGAPDGLVRKLTNTPNERMTYDAYVAARAMLSDRFGNSFQMTDLWNNDIPTLEEYSQSVSRHMYYFNRDLLAEPQDQIDPLPASILLYRFDPQLLRALGVRFVIADGSLSDPSIKRVMTETGKDDATVNLYELAGTNLGQLSPSRVMWAADYSTAVAALREHGEIGERVVLLGHPEPLPELVAASRSRLTALRDGYQLTASAPGNAMVVLPIQFSHCWQIESVKSAERPRIFRANIVQTGILFKNNIDVRLRFAFEPWRTSCRLQDARDLPQFGFR